jgi:hypothetical protein
VRLGRTPYNSTLVENSRLPSIHHPSRCLAEWQIINSLKRSPTWGERMLVHATLNCGDCECFALVPENFDPSALAQLHESLPKVPGPRRMGNCAKGNFNWGAGRD